MRRARFTLDPLVSSVCDLPSLSLSLSLSCRRDTAMSWLIEVGDNPVGGQTQTLMLDSEALTRVVEMIRGLREVWLALTKLVPANFGMVGVYRRYQKLLRSR